MRVVAIICAILAASEISASVPNEMQRSEIPIRERLLSDGTRRYAISVRIGSTPIVAGLDTGSSGLRVLADAVKPGDAEPSNKSASYGFDSGAQLKGVVAQTRLAIGDLSARTPVQLVRSVSCSPNKPQCPASRISPTQYGIQGDGIPGQGFQAIIGISMAGSEIGTPLRSVGAKRWIIDLPRSSEETGRLVINPSEDEVKGYTMLPISPEFSREIGGLHDAVSGCIENTVSKETDCGPVMMDTGVPGIYVASNRKERSPWNARTPAIIVFYDGHGHAMAKETLEIDLRGHASDFRYEWVNRNGPPRVYSGITAYFAFSILYDPDHGLIGLKPRDQALGGPRGELVPMGERPIKGD